CLDESEVEATLKKFNTLATNIEAMLAENRPALQEITASMRDLTAQIQQALAQDQPKIAKLLDGFDGTRLRLDLALDQTRNLAAQGNDFFTRNRTSMDRIVSNGKDTTDFAVKLVQKLYGNPFYLSPFYKPTRADVQAQEFYDVANSFVLGA